MGLLGANGAGKTSTFKVLSMIQQRDNGKYLIRNQGI